MTETLLDRIRGCLDAAMDYNKNDGEKPVALLWPDKQQQWGGVLEPLRETHRIVSFGDYDESAFIGPAYWLRCVVSGTIDPEGLGMILALVLDLLLILILIPNLVSF